MIGLTVALLAMVVFVVGGLALLLALKAVLWLVLLPLRILLGALIALVVLPLVLLKAIVLALAAVVVAPIVLLTTAVGLIATLAAVTAPLFPLFCIGFVVWVVMRSRRAVAA
jgi:hypothetical protein